MNKNLNPLNWTKKQQIIGGAVAVVLVGGIATGVMVNANHQAQQRKIEQALKTKVALAKKRAEKAKQLEKQSEADTKKLLDVAEKVPSDNNIKLAEDSILKVNDLGVKKVFTNQLLAIKERVKLESTAKTAVSSYQKDNMNQDKYKTAQQAVSKLTSPYSKGLKDTLNKQLETSKKQADDTTKAQQAKSPSDSKAEATNTNKEQSNSTGNATNSATDNSNNANADTGSQNTVNNNVASGSNSYGGGSQNDYSQGGSNTSQNNSNAGSSNQGQGNSGQNNSGSNSNSNTGGNGSNTNNNNNNGSNGGNNNNNQPQTRYVGWVSVDGVRRYSQTFNTLAEAQSYADSVKNSEEVVNLLLDGHSIRYGVEPA